MTMEMTRRGFLASAAVSAAAGAPAGAWQIGCYTRPWAKLDYRVALDGIAEAGYKYAGLMGMIRNAVDTTPGEAAEVAEEVRKRGLQTASVYGADFNVRLSIDAGIAGLRKLIDNCAAFGSPRLLLGGTGKPDLVEPYYKVVKECCDYGVSKNVSLSVKPHGGTNATGAACRKIIEKVGHKNFGIWYDPGNIFYYSDGALDPVDDAPSVDGLVMGVSVKDFKPPKEVNVTPGTGKVNFREVFARLKRGGFTSGPLIVECLDARPTAAEINAEARKARRMLEELTA